MNDITKNPEYNFFLLSYLIRQYEQQNHEKANQGRILTILKHTNSLSLAELAYLLGLKPQLITGLTEKMVTSGLISTSHETHNPSFQITAYGMDKQIKFDEADTIFSPLSTSEAEDFEMMLKKIITHVESKMDDHEEHKQKFHKEERFGRKHHYHFD